MAINLELVNESYSGKSVPEMAAMMKELKERAEKADRIAKDLKAELDHVRTNIIPDAMDDLGVSSMNIKGVGRLTITGDARVNTVGGMKEALFEWLNENDFSELITEVVNASTLKAFYKEQKEAGNPLPPEDVVRYEPFSRASITKS
jgi:hypothetical protein